MTALLAYRPLLDPLPLTGIGWWLTLIPAAVLISIAYKAVRKPTLDGYWRAVGVMSLQIVAAMAFGALGVHAVVEWIAPALGA